MPFGLRVYGLGVMALAMVCLAWGDFDPGQPVPKNFPDRPALAYAAAAFMLVAGAAVEWRRTVAWGAAALTAYYALVVVVLMNGRVVLAHFAEFGTYSGVAEQLAIAAGGLIIYADSAKIDAGMAARLTRLGQLAFGICADSAGLMSTLRFPNGCLLRKNSGLMRPELATSRQALRSCRACRPALLRSY
jgi:hypothetical protein